MQTHSIHIVRRYGPVGGMENYVYQLTQSLAQQEQKVTVLCEFGESRNYDKRINVVEVGNSFKKPRWLAQWGFSRRVSRHLSSYPQDMAIVHSHERTSRHAVTTFHGPPFLLRKHRVLDFLSPRIHMWTYLERQEVMGQQVKAVLPNSPLIADQLTHLYPMIADKVLAPAYPGVASHFSEIKRRSTGVTVGFLGREWKRKGLDIACQILLGLRELVPNVHFMVAGCDPEEIAHLFDGWPQDTYTLAGWVSDPDEFLGLIDVLLHPARSEPFGMVVAEANAAHIPVVVSEHCGVAALVNDEQGVVCPLAIDHPDIRVWVDACAALLQKPSTVQSMNLSWDALAQQHIQLYQALA
jgi:UDP-glucose:(heptosyl)LPS alpha-1,3-glucosyltransferase